MILVTLSCLFGLLTCILFSLRITINDRFYSLITTILVSVMEENSVEISMQMLLYNLLHQLADLLKKQSCTWKSLHCLRLFYVAEKHPHNDLENGRYAVNFKEKLPIFNSNTQEM